MNNNINNNNDDRKIRELLAGTKIKAGDNLKYRIMHQIQAEQALSRKVSKKSIPLLRNIIPVLVVMYILIVAIVVVSYALGGINAIESSTFFMSVLLVSIVGSLFWIVSCLDDSRRSKSRKS